MTEPWGRPRALPYCCPLVFCFLIAAHSTLAAFTFDATDPEVDTSQVEVVQGYNASLPCAIRSPPLDAPTLTLWYIATGETPVYSYDQRPTMRHSSWSDGEVFGQRASYLPMEHPPVLLLSNVSTQDARLYRCRVDYHKSNSRQAWVRLSVIVPPTRIEVVSRMSPVELGQTNDVVCRVSGGTPLARVVWLQDGQAVDSNSTTGEGHIAYNDLEVPATRRDLTSPFTCRASNNDVTAPLIATYQREVNCGPLSVTIEPEERPLVAGRQAKLVCTVVGSNPPPLVTWYQQGQQVTPLHTQVQVSENMTVSVLLLEVTRRHHGRQLVCRAQHPTLPLATLEDIFTLDVSYKPSVNLTLGRTLDPKNLKEGNDLFFDCSVDANPPPYKVRWLHQGEELVQNVSAGVLVSDLTLALQSVGRQRSGRYQCVASNVEGDAHSHSVDISIKYAPRCAVAPALRGVALFELTNITCVVDADPINVTFKWTFNNSVRRDQSEVVSSRRYTQEGLSSTLSYTPMSERDYGTLLCFATNNVGGQNDPCSFTIISAGPPEEVSNCSVVNVTSHSAGISCLPGFDGGLPQKFQLQVWEIDTGRLVLNTSGSTPVFSARPLEPDRNYRASIHAYNSRGRTSPTRLHFLTLKEAEMHKSLPSMVEPSPLVLIMGVVAGVLVVVGALLLAIWLVKERRTHAHRDTTVTQIVLKDNNPDLLSVEASEEGAAVRVNGSVKATVYTSSGQTNEMSSYQRYDEDAASLYGSSSPEATERTRLTSSSNSSSSKGGGVGGGGVVPLGRTGGNIGVNLLRGGLGGPSTSAGVDIEPDLRRQTTVRLFVTSSPEASF
ncbi:nephrin isoform X2 [Procambarus clarkii]|uniref:nephrin isoform X2 n=1 Tax=Procambarus clarkii TaxID=6728 RepID=UPI0037437B41